MADLRAIGNKIRTLIDSAVKRDQARHGACGRGVGGSCGGLPAKCR